MPPRRGNIPRRPRAVQAIERLRGSIDNVDTAIVMLLAERFKYNGPDRPNGRPGPGSPPPTTNGNTARSHACGTLAEQAGLDPDIAESSTPSW